LTRGLDIRSAKPLAISAQALLLPIGQTMLTLQTVVEHLAGHHAYLGILGLLLLGSLGVPIPEELPIISAGVLSQAGYARWWLALPVCLLGVLSGDVILYWVGHHWGEQVLDWHIVRRLLSRDREQWLKDAYRRHAIKTIVMARHIMGLRATAFLTAGIARVSFWKFLATDAAAALGGVPFSFALAYFFADQVEAIVADMHRAERWLALGGVLVLAAVLGMMARRWTRQVERGARQEPGRQVACRRSGSPEFRPNDTHV
jgi:membrane protein DedA with SNARE-associated domain